MTDYAIIYPLAAFTLVSVLLFAFYQMQIAKKTQGKGKPSSLASDGDPNDAQG